ncbi:MAG TPA: RagB/SusD family nutrient uptake outer membrane protein [Bacteroidales bacterium]|nr:RagB/SusD family nutrient uptake outer membrane protein [Bacteroidales bacterium]
MKRYIISFAVLTLFLVSCTDLTDELYDRIPNDKYPENAGQAALITVPVYSSMQGLIDGGGWWFLQEIPSDEMVAPTRLTDWDDGGKWRALHTHTWTNTTEAVASLWFPMYSGIGQANKLIEANQPFAGQPAADLTIAKVKTMRAFYYYILIDNYGDVPFETNYANAVKTPTKTSKAVIFNAIVKDVEDAIVVLKTNPGNSKISVNLGMAYTLLTKLYLNAEVYTGTAQWVKAEAAAKAVIDLGTYSLETEALKPFITENQFSPENIFQIPFDEDSYTGFNLHMRTLHYLNNQTFGMTAGPWNGFAASEDHFNTFDAADARKKGFLVGQQYDLAGKKLVEGGKNVILDPHIPALLMDGTFTPEQIRFSGARVAKFEIKKAAKENLSNDFPLFRYADVLLMKAEAAIRQGKNGDAEINQVRARAGVPNFTNTTLDQLLAERGREMFWEGHRRQDLIRFGKFNAAWWEKPASSPDRNTFPIPQWVKDTNPNL